MTATRRIPLILWFLCLAALVASVFFAHDRLTWLLEVAWVIVGLILLPLLWKRFPLTPLLYWLLFLHAVILIVGGIYTYERVPLGEWMKSWFGWQRNHYDRLGHLAQGFIPAILIREILLRRSPLVPGWLLGFLVVSVALAFSAFFELIEWWTALALGHSADAYLGTQGDPWDTQSDMFCALIGAIVSMLCISRVHDRQLLSLLAQRSSAKALHQ